MGKKKLKDQKTEDAFCESYYVFWSLGLNLIEANEKKTYVDQPFTVHSIEQHISVHPTDTVLVVLRAVSPLQAGVGQGS